MGVGGGGHVSRPGSVSRIQEVKCETSAYTPGLSSSPHPKPQLAKGEY